MTQATTVFGRQGPEVRILSLRPTVSITERSSTQFTEQPRLRAHNALIRRFPQAATLYTGECDG